MKKVNGWHILIYIFLILGAIASLFPFYWVLVMATNKSAAVFRFPPVMTFSSYFIENVKNLLQSVDFSRAMLNTLLVAGIKTVVAVIFCSMAAFYFAKFRFPGRNFLFAIIMLTMMIPTQLQMIPLMIMMNHFGWTNTYQALIFPNLITAFGIFWMRQYCIGAIHDDLLNAGRIDGCSTFGLYWHIGLPIVRPGFAFLAIYTFMDCWNDYLWPMIITNSQRMYTIQVALMQLNGAYNHTDYGKIMSGTFLAVLPLMIIFIFFSGQFTADIAAGAVKD